MSFAPRQLSPEVLWRPLHEPEPTVEELELELLRLQFLLANANARIEELEEGLS